MSSTLPANSTFLPVLDDLLSPDFRPCAIPGQTPQTPAETPVSLANKTLFGESHTGQLTSKISTYGSSKDPMTMSLLGNLPIGHSEEGVVNGGSHSQGQFAPSPGDAATKIQSWWRSHKNSSSTHDPPAHKSPDIRAERAKHAIRHKRTEDHIRYLETEVQRLKAALSTERKLRSLQVEAIRSLWTQVQKVSSLSSPSGPVVAEVMSQSMPNGIFSNSNGCAAAKDPTPMSCSMYVGGVEGKDAVAKPQFKLPANTDVTAACSCAREIQSLKSTFATELEQLRKTISSLKNNSGCEEDWKSQQHVQKRPLTLNIAGHSQPGEKEEKLESEVSRHPVSEEPASSSSDAKGSAEKREKITGYANQMASSIIEDAKENNEPQEMEETLQSTSTSHKTE